MSNYNRKLQILEAYLGILIKCDFLRNYLFLEAPEVMRIQEVQREYVMYLFHSGLQYNQDYSYMKWHRQR